MTAWYVGNLATSGNGSGTLANPFKGWAGINWASIGAGDTLNVIGTVEVANEAAIGAHGGVQGNEVIIQGYGSGAKLAGQGDKIIFLNRSHTYLMNLGVDGQLTLDSPIATYLTTGTNIKIDGCDITTGGIRFYSYTDDKRYDNIKFINNIIHDAYYGVYLLGTTGGSIRKIQVNGLEIRNNIIQDITGMSAIELRFEGVTKITSDSYINDLVIVGNTIKRIYHQFMRILPAQVDTVVPSSDRVTITDNVMSDDGLIGGDNALGGVTLHGYGKNATKYVNIFQRNILTNSFGTGGLCNLLVSRYVDISNNIGSNITTGTIDGNGILIDLYNDNIKVYNNTLSNVMGKAGVSNSGAGIMILASSPRIHVHHNKCTRSRVGLYLGNITEDSVLINDCEFLECMVEGIRHSGNGLPIVINTRFTAYGDSANEIYSTQVNKNLAHGYNTYEGFATKMTNQTLNATESRSRISKIPA